MPQSLVFVAMGAPSLDLDITLLIELSLFFLTAILLTRFIIGPYLKSRRLRDALTTGAMQDADEMAAASAALSNELKEKQQQAFSVAESERKAMMAKANEEAAALINQARKEAQSQAIAQQNTHIAEIQSLDNLAAGQQKKLAMQISQKLLA